MILYHVGYDEIREPDIRHSRKNADFGQGFDMTSDTEFAGRWAQERRGSAVIRNTYELDTDGLVIRRFERDADWFNYLYGNRIGQPELYPEADVIMGPVANDTIYDTLGIITSGFLEPGQALRILQNGPVFTQVVLKTERATAQLQWLSAETLSAELIAENRAVRGEEEKRFLEQAAALLDDM